MANSFATLNSSLVSADTSMYALGSAELVFDELEWRGLPSSLDLLGGDRVGNPWLGLQQGLVDGVAAQGLLGYEEGMSLGVGAGPSEAGLFREKAWGDMGNMEPMDMDGAVLMEVKKEPLSHSQESQNQWSHGLAPSQPKYAPHLAEMLDAYTEPRAQERRTKCAAGSAMAKEYLDSLVESCVANEPEEGTFNNSNFLVGGSYDVQAAATCEASLETPFDASFGASCGTSFDATFDPSFNLSFDTLCDTSYASYLNESAQQLKQEVPYPECAEPFPDTFEGLEQLGDPDEEKELHSSDTVQTTGTHETAHLPTQGAETSKVDNSSTGRRKDSAETEATLCSEDLQTFRNMATQAVVTGVLLGQVQCAHECFQDCSGGCFQGCLEKDRKCFGDCSACPELSAAPCVHYVDNLTHCLAYSALAVPQTQIPKFPAMAKTASEAAAKRPDSTQMEEIATSSTCDELLLDDTTIASLVAAFKASRAPPCLRKRAKGSKNIAPPEREIDYSQVKLPTVEIPCPELMNFARNEITPLQLAAINAKTLRVYPEVSQTLCLIARKCYIRLSIHLLVPEGNIRYERNSNFHISRPYEPQVVRYEVDSTNGLPFNPTRCGLCPYCEKLTFLNLKTSSYAQHLALTHGIYTDNFLAPNPYNFGEYRLAKAGCDRVTTAHENNRLGVVCPSCNQVVGTHCSQTTAKDRPLNNFLRHFRDTHRKRGKANTSGGVFEFFNKLVRPESYVYNE